MYVLEVSQSEPPRRAPYLLPNMLADCFRGGRRTTAATMIDQCKKSHRAKNLSSCSYSAFCAYTADTHHAAMMSRIGGCEEALNLAWRLPRQRLGSRPPWSEGACSLANLPSKTQPTTTPQCLSKRCDVNCRQRPLHTTVAHNDG